MVLRTNGWKNHQRLRKKKEMIIYKAPPVMCKCGVKSNYGLVHSEPGICHYCGHMVDYDEVGYFVINMKSYFVSFAKTYMIYLNRALENVGGNVMMVKLSSWMN